MKYRLKDRGLQKKLDEISKGDLSDALEVCSAAVASALKRGKPTTIWFGVQPQLSLEITYDMLEEVREYDPTKWNNYPEVEPPEGVWMRVEWRDGVVKHLAVARYEAWGGGKQFVWVSDKRIIREVDRFRPRDDPDGEEDEE